MSIGLRGQPGACAQTGVSTPSRLRFSPACRRGLPSCAGTSSPSWPLPPMATETAVIRDRRLLQSLRHRQGLVHRRTGRGGPVGLFRSLRGDYRERGATADGGGTSFAAPMVTGALVVMKNYFRDELYNTDLVARLLATANKGGIYADSDVYGQGLLDLAAATSPAGSINIALDGRVAGASVALAETSLGLGSALGDGLIRPLAGQEIAAFDDLGAPFWYSLGSLTGAASRPRSGWRGCGISWLNRAQAEWSLSPWHLRARRGRDTANGSHNGGTALRLGLLDSPDVGEASERAPLPGRTGANGWRDAGQGRPRRRGLLNGGPRWDGARHLALRSPGGRKERRLACAAAWMGEREAASRHAGTWRLRAHGRRL